MPNIRKCGPSMLFSVNPRYRVFVTGVDSEATGASVRGSRGVMSCAKKLDILFGGVSVVSQERAQSEVVDR